MAAIFARTGYNTCCAGPLEWKIPGSVNLDELRSAKHGPRTGGFGPFYAPVLLAGIAALFKLRAQTPPDWRFLTMLGSAVLSCLLFPEPWWARYIPFIGCLAPLLMIAAGWNPPRPLQIFVAALMGFNALVFVANEVSANLAHHSAEQELRRLSAENEVVIGIGGGQAIFLQHYFRMRGIPAAVGTCASATAHFFGLPVCRRSIAKTL
jgi:hypothetical protein